MDVRTDPILDRDAGAPNVRWLDAERGGARPGEAAALGTDRAVAEPAAGTRAGIASGRRRVILVGVAVAVALAAAIGLRMRAVAPPSAQASANAIPLVSVSSAGLSAVNTRVSFTGTIRARYEMPVGAESESGRVAAVYVEAGDRVQRGQVLARLDTSILGPQVARLSASLDQARAEAELAAAESRRAEGVEAAGALSAEEIERRRSTAVTRQAQVKVAAAQLAEAQARFGRSEIRAPEAGVVLSRAVEVGQTVTPGGAPLFRLARDGQVEMYGQVAEQDLPSLAVGQSARIWLTGIEQPFEGKVRLLGATIDPQSRLGEVRIALASDPNLRPGAFARGEVTVTRGERPVLPQTAILTDTRGNYVLVVDPQDRVQRKAVRIAGTEGGGVVIAEGLSGGERIVTTAGAFLREGERVRIAGQGGAAAGRSP